MQEHDAACSLWYHPSYSFLSVHCMESHRRGGPPPIPGSVRREPVVGGFSFERRQQVPHSYPERQPVAPVEPEFGYEVSLKPRELFDPHKNAAHAEWLREQLKEVREGSFTLGALMAVMGITLTTMSASMPLVAPDLVSLGYPGVAFGTLFAALAGREIRAALAKRKMGLSDNEG